LGIQVGIWERGEERRIDTKRQKFKSGGVVTGLREKDRKNGAGRLVSTT